MKEVSSVNSKDDSYYADVIYIVNGQKYNADYSSSSYIKKGDFVNIYYDKNNPSYYHHTISNIGTIIMSIMGVITFIVGGIILRFLIRKSNNDKRIVL